MKLIIEVGSVYTIVLVTLSSVLRNEDLKEMLESNKESLKLEAMKRVVGVSASWVLCVFSLNCLISVTQMKYLILFGLFPAYCQREKFIRAVSCCCEERCEQEYRGKIAFINTSQETSTLLAVIQLYRVWLSTRCSWCRTGNFLI